MDRVKMYCQSVEQVEDDSGEMVPVEQEVLIGEAECTITSFAKSDINADGYNVPAEMVAVFIPFNYELWRNSEAVKFDGDDKSYIIADRKRFKRRRKMAFYIKGYR